MNKFLQNIFSENKSTKKKKIPPQYLVMLLILGILLMIGSNFFSPQPKSSKGAVGEGEETVSKVKSQSPSDYKEKYEGDLTETLNSMKGVKNVQVAITLISSERAIYEKNQKTVSQQTTEEDKQGGKRTVAEETNEEQIVIVKKEGEEVPVISNTETPEIKGVLVVAEGVENLKIKESVIEAVTRFLGVARHKVSVQPKG